MLLIKNCQFFKFHKINWEYNIVVQMQNRQVYDLFNMLVLYLITLLCWYVRTQMI
jgi:hypothetical protein